MKSALNRTSVIRRDHQVPNIEISNVINSGGPPVHQLDRVQGAPISLFTSTNADQMAFPTFVSRWDKWLQDF